MALPDTPSLLDVFNTCQQAVSSLDFPKPPTPQMMGQLSMDYFGLLGQRLGTGNPFPGSMPPPPGPPPPPAGLPNVPQPPIGGTPLQLPFS